MDHVAKALDMDVEVVKKMNLYQKGQVSLYTDVGQQGQL